MATTNSGGMSVFAEDVGITVGGNATSNSNALQSFNNKNNNATLIFSKGQYNFSSPVVLNKTIHIRGANYSTLNYTGTGAFLTFVARHSTAKDIRVNGNANADGFQLGIDSSPFTYGVFDSVYFTGFRTCMIFHRCWIINLNSVRVMQAVNGWSMPYVANAINAYGCHIEGCTGTALSITGGEIGTVNLNGLCCEGNKEYVKISSTSGYQLVSLANCYFEQGKINKDNQGVYLLDINSANAVVTVYGGQYYRGFVRVQNGQLRRGNDTALTVVSGTNAIVEPTVTRKNTMVSAIQNPVFECCADFTKTTTTKDKVITEPAHPEIGVTSKTSSNGQIMAIFGNNGNWKNKVIIFDIETNGDISANDTISVSYYENCKTYKSGQSTKISYTDGLKDALNLSINKRMQIVCPINFKTSESFGLALKIGTRSFQIKSIGVKGLM